MTSKYTASLSKKEKTERPCMRCGKIFKSEGKFHRLCNFSECVRARKYGKTGIKSSDGRVIRGSIEGRG